MNKMIAGPIAAFAIPAAAAAALTEDTATRDASLARAEEVVNLLRTRYVRQGWKIDEEGAERALAYCRAYATDGSDLDEEREAALDFFHDHGISLDWIFRGDVAGLITGAASHSTRAQRIGDAELVALTQEYLTADKRHCELALAVMKIEDDLLAARRERPIPDALHWRESDADLLPHWRPEDDVWDTLTSIEQMRRNKWSYHVGISTEDEITSTIKFVEPSPAARARAAEILAAYDQWCEEEKPPRGYQKLKQKRDKAGRMADMLLTRVAETPGSTVGGLFAKGRCAGHLAEVEIDMGGNPSGEIAMSIFRDLERLADAGNPLG